MNRDEVNKMSFEELNNLLSVVLDELDIRKFGDGSFPGTIIEPDQIKEYIKNKYAAKRKKAS